MLNRIAISFAICLPSLAGAQISANQFKQLYQLSGVWSMETNKGLLYESWRLVNASEMEGKSFRLVENDTIFLEKVRLIDSSSSVFYIPLVSGQNNGLPVFFRQIPSVENEFIFENKTHDFPQRVIYRFINSENLMARTEGDKDGKLVTFEFPYKRVGVYPLIRQ